MNKNTLLGTLLLTLLIIVLAVTVPPVIKFVKEIEDLLKLVGLVTVSAGTVKLIQLVKEKLKK